MSNDIDNWTISDGDQLPHALVDSAGNTLVEGDMASIWDYLDETVVVIRRLQASLVAAADERIQAQKDVVASQGASFGRMLFRFERIVNPDVVEDRINDYLKKYFRGNDAYKHIDAEDIFTDQAWTAWEEAGGKT